MNGAFGNFRDLGALVIWTFNLFKVKFKDCQENKYSFRIGLGITLLLVLILLLIT